VQSLFRLAELVPQVSSTQIMLWQEAGSASNRWKGWLDEVAVFRSALSVAQVQALWAARSSQVTIMSWNE
jgi:hypothetical protein